MKVLSLFDGMACGMIAMQLAGMEVESYDAYEIDKYAIKTARHNFPMIKEHGDVFGADFTQYEGVDFLIGGSPCTYWSIAQTKNRETVASGMGWELFNQYVRALHEAKPKYFIYENNKSMSKAIRASIDEIFGFEAVLINSALVSAQNRQRIYWVGKRNDDGTYSKVDVEQPEDRGILLRDIMENGTVWQEKSYNLTTRCCGAIPEDTLKRHRHTMVADPVCVAERGRMYCGQPQHYEARTDGKTNTLTSVEKDNRVTEPVRCMQYELKERYVRDSGCVARLDMPKCHDILTRVYGWSGKCPTLTAHGGGNTEPKVFDCYSVCFNYSIEFDGDGKPIKAVGKDGKEITIYEVRDGKITIKGKQYPIKLKDGFYIIRKLTVRECMRLQTVPEWYEFPVSDSQAYKMLGNGWTCEVIAHILKSLKEA